MATSLDKSENKVEIDHLHPKHLHIVKRLQKSVQYIRRYSTKYTSFWPCHTRRSHMSSVNSGVTGQISRNFHTIYRHQLRCYCTHWCCNIPFRFWMPKEQMLGSLPFFTKSVAMATSIELSKEVQIDHLHPKRFHSVKRLRKSDQRILN